MRHRIGSTPRSVLLVAAVGFLAVILGVLLRFPGVAMPLVAAVAVAVASVLRPDLVLSAAVVLGLAGGAYASWSTVGYVLATVGGAVSLLMVLSRKTWHHLIAVVLLPLITLSLLAIRFVLAGDDYFLTVAMRCAGIVFLTIYAVARRGDPLPALALASVVFIGLTLIVGDTSATGMRLSGFSGNPNRMVFGCLILLPFLLAFLWRRKSVFRHTLTAVTLGVNGYVLFLSGSSQALFGLVVLSLVVIAYLLSSTHPLARMLLWIYTVVALILALATIDLEPYLSDDLITLSGRTDLYSAAWDEFTRNPLFGTGMTSVSSGDVMDRSAHSSWLGLLAAGGLVVGIPWAMILLRICATGLSMVSSRNIAGAAAVLFVVEQLVQSVEYTQLAWFVVAYFFVHTKLQKIDTAPVRGVAGAAVQRRRPMLASLSRRR
ncbi:O-antigen ligase family protein [Microbacterium sp. RD1]|uniref:O-antigen ligase family protein n=1 Tax=Microbacterium sp. RD1 TaxID=3457313 RepID=UPI003FA54B00